MLEDKRGVGARDVRIGEDDVVAVVAADGDDSWFCEPPGLQGMPLGRIQEMDDRTEPGGWLEMIGHPSTFPPGLVENAHQRRLIVNPILDARNCRLQRPDFDWRAMRHSVEFGLVPCSRELLFSRIRNE